MNKTAITGIAKTAVRQLMHEQRAASNGAIVTVVDQEIDRGISMIECAFQASGLQEGSSTTMLALKDGLKEYKDILRAHRGDLQPFQSTRAVTVFDVKKLVNQAWSNLTVEFKRQWLTIVFESLAWPEMTLAKISTLLKTVDYSISFKDAWKAGGFTEDHVQVYLQIIRDELELQIDTVHYNL